MVSMRITSLNGDDKGFSVENLEDLVFFTTWFKERFELYAYKLEDVIFFECNELFHHVGSLLLEDENHGLEIELISKHRYINNKMRHQLELLNFIIDYKPRVKDLRAKRDYLKNELIKNIN